jgi:ribosomal protein L28
MDVFRNTKRNWPVNMVDKWAEGGVLVVLLSDDVIKSIKDESRFPAVIATEIGVREVADSGDTKGRQTSRDVLALSPNSGHWVMAPRIDCEAAMG